MKVLCTDGTAIDCDDFRAVESGVVLLDEQVGDAIGFVPSHRVEYVLPDALVGEGWTPLGETRTEEIPVGEPGLAAPSGDREAVEGATTGTLDRTAGGTGAGGEVAVERTGAAQSVELGLLREQVEALQARLELMERRSGLEGAETAGQAEPVEHELVREIDGLGPTYVRRLQAAGIETVADLATASPVRVAEAAETAENRAEDWIQQAKERS